MSTRKLTLMALLLATLIVCSQLAIPLGPVPITMQTFAVLVIGLILPAKEAGLVTIVYLLAGLVGLPVFSQGSGGPASILSPSFGFIIGYIPAAYLCQHVKNHAVKARWPWPQAWACLVASLIIYLFGVTYFIFASQFIMDAPVGIGRALSLTMLPFIPGDIIKAVMAITVSHALKPIIRKFI